MFVCCLIGLGKGAGVESMVAGDLVTRTVA